MYPYLGPAARAAARGAIAATKRADITKMLNTSGRHLNEDGWTSLADGPAHVRAGVASSINCPATLHDTLLNDKARSVKAAAQTHTPLSKLSTSEVEHLLRAASYEMGTGQAISTHILNTNPNPSVESMTLIVNYLGLEELAARYDLSERIEEVTQYVDSYRPRDVEAIRAAFRTYPHAVKKAWAQGVESERVIAAATLESPAALTKLAKDPSVHVRMLAGLNPHANLTAVAAWLTKSPSTAEDLTRWVGAGGNLEELAAHALTTHNTTLAQELVKATTYTSHPPVLTGQGAGELIDMLAASGQDIEWSSITAATPAQLLAALQAAYDKTSCAVEVADHDGASWEVVCAASAHMRVYPATIENVPQAHIENLAMSSVAELALKWGQTKVQAELAAKLYEVAEQHTWPVVQTQVRAPWAGEFTLGQFAQAVQAVLAHPTATTTNTQGPPQ